MAVAGKVAITLSTENGGAWSADVTYDRLVAVKYNNNLYISRKTVANVEPPNDEFWFLALEGFGGDDVQALIDRMNELSDLIQAIIDGTTQVGNAKTLDGHGADYFSPLSELAKYLPLSAKPTGTYTGNGSAEPRTIATNGIGKVCVVNGGGRTAYVSIWGAIILSGTSVVALDYNKLNFNNGVLKVATTDYINDSGETYTWDVL